MDRLEITKLNGRNYSIWNTKEEFLLVREESWQYVSEKRPELGAGPGAADEARIRTWDNGDQKARATIGLLLEDNQLNLIKGTKTARDTWESLRRHYEKSTLTSKVSLLKQMCEKRYNDGNDIERHVFSMDSSSD